MWKLAKPNEPQWESPWGNGRPGWHIECSAMATKILGQPFDIHGGGMDLKFPHHENEIAQSECAYHKPFANIWMHAGLLNIDGNKMSKSLNNFFTIRDVMENYSAEVIRYFMLASHYRSPVDYSKDTMEKAAQALTRLYTAIRGISEETNFIPSQNDFTEKFFASMDDDFNSPVAISILFDMAREINILREAGKIEDAKKIASQLKYCASVFGILQKDPEIFFQGDVNDNFSDEVDELITKRNEARKNKNFAEADRIRKQLQEMNIVIEDAGNKTTWRKV